MTIRIRALIVALCCLAVISAEEARSQDLDSLLTAAQNRVDESETLADQVLALTNFANLLNRSERHTEALDVISEAAQLAGVPRAIDVRSAGLPDSLGASVDILLVRALTHEGLNQYAEARNDLVAFLSVEPSGLFASMAGSRRDTLDILAVGDRATLARFDPDELRRFYDADEAALRIGVLPFLNTTETLLWNWVGYGLTGFLRTVLDHLSRSITPPILPDSPTNLAAVLNSVSLGRIYSQEAETQITGPQMGMVLGSRFLISGTISTGENILGLPRITSALGDAEQDSNYILPELVGSSLPDSIRKMQTDLAMSVADKLQEIVGFEYHTSREAFADTIVSLAIPDLQTFMAYGRSIELAIGGEFDDALSAIESYNIPAAVAWRYSIAEMRQAIGSSSVSLGTFQDSLDVRIDYRIRATEEPPPPTSRAVASATAGTRSLLLGRMLTLSGQTALGAEAVSDMDTGAYLEMHRLYGVMDPRDGIEGINRTQPGQVSVQIVIPIPPPGSGRKR